MLLWSTYPLQGGAWAVEGGRGRWRRDRRQGLQGLLPGQVVRFVEQIIEDVGKEEVFKVFSQACVTSSVLCGSGGVVVRREQVARAVSVGNPWNVVVAALTQRQVPAASGRCPRVRMKMVFLGVFTPFFALRPDGRECPFFSPRALTAVSARGLWGWR